MFINLKTITLIVMLLTLTGCANLSNSEQRMVSGAAIGGTLAGPIGAGLGAGVGYIIHQANK
jgi:uncharacterized lipoprotein NlpE involved in copper resistance